MIHSENPFRPEPGDRDQARRFRGRLAAGVTIVTAGSDSERTGLTVSSLFVIEGEPGRVHLLAGPATDLWSLAAETGRFIVHICRFDHHRLAEVFAGLSPSPGGLFATVATNGSEWGPELDDLPDRLYCTFVSREEAGWSGLIVGTVDKVEVSNLTDPLIHFRSSYRRLAP
jgi:flavin reductase (DIM6/NTAB) family NADH-FMN oxidoreductase RutF